MVHGLIGDPWSAPRAGRLERILAVIREIPPPLATITGCIRTAVKIKVLPTVGILPTGDLRLRFLSHIQLRSRTLSGSQHHSRRDLRLLGGSLSERCVLELVPTTSDLLSCVKFA